MLFGLNGLNGLNRLNGSAVLRVVSVVLGSAVISAGLLLIYHSGRSKRRSCSLKTVYSGYKSKYRKR